VPKFVAAVKKSEPVQITGFGTVPRMVQSVQLAGRGSWPHCWYAETSWVPLFFWL
jgi:hypothetical protein